MSLARPCAGWPAGAVAPAPFAAAARPSACACGGSALCSACDCFAVCRASATPATKMPTAPTPTVHERIYFPPAHLPRSSGNRQLNRTERRYRYILVINDVDVRIHARSVNESILLLLEGAPHADDQGRGIVRVKIDAINHAHDVASRRRLPQLETGRPARSPQSAANAAETHTDHGPLVLRLKDFSREDIDRFAVSGQLIHHAAHDLRNSLSQPLLPLVSKMDRVIG